MIREFINMDINEDYARHFAMKDETQKKEYIDGFFNTRLPEKLSIINDWIKKNGNGRYIIGNSLTLADFAVWDLANRFLTDPRWKERSIPVFEKFPELQEYLKKRDEDPKYQEYEKKRVIPTLN